VRIHVQPIVEELHHFLLHHMVMEAKANFRAQSHVTARLYGLHCPVLLSGCMLVNTTMLKMIRDDVEETQKRSALIKGRHCSQAQKHPNRSHDAILAVGCMNR
jgi:hypothetical protein